MQAHISGMSQRTYDIHDTIDRSFEGKTEAHGIVEHPTSTHDGLDASLLVHAFDVVNVEYVAVSYYGHPTTSFLVGKLDSRQVDWFRILLVPSPTVDSDVGCSSVNRGVDELRCIPVERFQKRDKWRTRMRECRSV